MDQAALESDPLTGLRFYLTDGQFLDARLATPWDVFVHGLMTNGAVILNNAFINRSHIARIIRFDPRTGVVPDGENVVEFRPKT